MSKKYFCKLAITFLSATTFTCWAAPYPMNPQPVMQGGFPGAGPMNTPAAQLQVIPVMTAPTGSSVVLGGTVVPLREVTLAAQIPGRIDYLAGVEGEFFEAGEVVAAIDDDDLLARRAQALANLGAQSHALQNSQVQYSKEFWSPRLSGCRPNTCVRCCLPAFHGKRSVTLNTAICSLYRYPICSARTAYRP